MSKLVVSWLDSKGRDWTAQTLYDTETDEFWDWDFIEGKYIKRPPKTTNKEKESK